MNIFRNKTEDEIKKAKLKAEISEQERQLKLLNLEVKRFSGLKNAYKELIYQEIRRKKKEEKKLIELKGYDIDLIQEKNIFNLFGLFKKKWYSLALHIGRDSVLHPIAITETLAKTIDIMKIQKYIIGEEFTKDYKKIYYKGRRVLHLTPDYPINAEFNAKSKEFFCDSETFNFLINNVVDYELTKPVKQPLNIIEFFKKYWWLIIIIIIGIIISQTEGGISGALGL